MGWNLFLNCSYKNCRLCGYNCKCHCQNEEFNFIMKVYMVMCVTCMIINIVIYVVINLQVWWE